MASSRDNTSDVGNIFDSYKLTIGYGNALGIQERRRAHRNRKKSVDEAKYEPNKDCYRPSLEDGISGNEETSVLKSILLAAMAIPIHAICNVANRMKLLMWRASMWANDEGDTLLQIEDKLAELQKAKDLLVHEKASLEGQIYYLQRLVEDKSSALERERTLNQRLLDRIQQMSIAAGSWNAGKSEGQKLTILFHSMISLNSFMDQLSQRIESNANEMDAVYGKVIKMIEHQKRLEGHEKLLTKMLTYMANVCEQTKIEQSKKKSVGCSRCSGIPNKRLSISKTIAASDSDFDDDSSGGCTADNWTENVIADQRAAARQSRKTEGHCNLSFFEIAKTQVYLFLRTKINYKLLCLILSFALFSFLASLNVLLMTKEIVSSSIIYRISQLFAHIWSVFLL